LSCDHVLGFALRVTLAFCSIDLSREVMSP